MHNTVGGKAGRDADHLDTLKGRRVTDAMNVAVEPHSGDEILPFNGDYGSGASIYVRQDQPLPMTILGVMPKLTTEGRG
jgi:hypothetical protein